MPRRVAATASYEVRFGTGPSKEPEGGRVPRVARLLALAHKIDAMVRAGEFRDYADAARAGNLSRARLTQLANLLLLPPEVQDAILDLPTVNEGRTPITERSLRGICAEPDWEVQATMWAALKESRT